MADSKLVDLTDDPTPASTNLVYMVKDPSGTPLNRKATVANTATSILSLSPAWTTYAPTLTNVTLGNGTKTGRYLQTGKTIDFYVRLDFGSTTAHTGSVSFSLPVASIDYTGNSGYATIVGRGALVLSSAFDCVASWLTTTTAELDTWNTAGTYSTGAVVNATVPTTLGTGHGTAVWAILGRYEAA